MSILIKIPGAYFTDLEQIFQKFIWNKKKPKVSENLKKKNKVEGITTPIIELYYKPTVIKTVCYWHRNRYMDNGIE